MIAAVVILTLPPILVVGLLWWIYHNQARLLFAPRKKREPIAEPLGKEGQIFFIPSTEGIRLEAWYFPPPSEKDPVFLFCHGNTGNLTWYQKTIEHLRALGAGILVFDYRGYGNSTGQPSEEGLAQDATAAWQWLTGPGKIDPQRVILYGRSLGAAVVARLSAGEGSAAGGVIMESGFSHLDAMREHLYPFFPGSLAHFTLDSRPWVGKRHCPLLLAHSTQETYIPFTQAKELFARAREPKTLHRLRGSHARGWQESWPEYQHVLRDFARHNALSDK
ncbi:MAG: alpha/beta hydrolase [Opitutales bacterium]|nr:alpha/beta hydrolase [Opitutales bacterium]MCH8540976.1 alpha/beta hydrolase [Opitutales bacterium]